MIFNQAGFDVRCEWGERGVRELSATSDAIIIVDVMSFSTCVTVAVSRGATVFPYRHRDDSRIDFAKSVDATLAGPRGKSKYSLSPASLMSIPRGARLVLPSPNGSTLTLMTGDTPTYCGCLRNCRAVAHAAMRRGKKIAVIPAGERWKEDGSLRPAVEDLLGAGAIIEHLKGSLSPEAEAARAVYRNPESNMQETLNRCISGRELTEKGFAHDVRVSADVDADDCAPVLRDGAYVKE
jgi:2-phosphosulfolactate phosphatase